MQVRDVKARLAAAGVRPSKGLGQHFLVDERYADRQIELGEISATDTVLEIGPGLGVLTDRLARVARRVVAVEADRRLARALEGRWGNVEVLHGDAVRLDLPPFDAAVANLPFQISSPITFRLLDRSFRRASLMFQEEFARRLVAQAGTDDYSRLSVKAYCRATCRIAATIPPSAFWPPPKVRSAIVVIEPRPWPFPVQDKLLYDAVVDALFAHRRKKIGTTLASAWHALGLSKPPRDDLPHRDRRVEELPPEEIAVIADALGGSRR